MKVNRKILARYISDKFTMKDQQSVKEYFTDEEYHKNLKEYSEEVYDEDVSRDILKKDMSGVLSNIFHEIKRTNRNANKIFYLSQSIQRIAAILLIPALICIGLLSYLLNEETEIFSQTVAIHAPIGTRTHFELPDGSSGWLNSNSILKYDPVFKNNRRVELIGEAWFDVKHKDNQDFIVTTAEMNVKVLGTKFNVLAYSDESLTEVILETGLVEVELIGSKLKERLIPDQQFKFNRKDHKYSIVRINSSAYTAWKDGVLIFRDMAFNEISKRLSRKYDAEIILHGEQLKKMILRATFSDESLDEIIKLIAITEPIEYKIHKRVKNASGEYSKKKIEIWLTN